MKRQLLLLLICLTTLSINAQNGPKKSAAKTPVKTEAKPSTNDTLNKWSFEINVGQSKGVKPYSTGYFSSNPEQTLGSIRINYYNVGARYMISPKFGIKGDISYDKFTNNPKSYSLPFETVQYRLGLQGVINASRLFGIEEQLNRLGLLIHAGIQFSELTPQTGINKNKTDNDGGIMFGVSPQFRITKKIAIVADVTMLTNFRQHLSWDGAFSQDSNNLSGQLISGSLGLSFSLGNDKIHGDWVIIPDKNLVNLEPLEKRIGDIETLMNDTDKDGVPDYLDQENNSVAGVAVDSRGKMVDLNGNGVPDELERYLQEHFTDKNSKDGKDSSNYDMIKKFINDGYVTTYFDTGKTVPTNVSSQGIDFMLTYLRNNPKESIDILGHADEIGKSEFNDKLALDRATTVKNTLIKAGVNPARLNVVSKGEDSSVDIDSADTRRLVRRVTFRVK